MTKDFKTRYYKDYRGQNKAESILDLPDIKNEEGKHKRIKVYTSKAGRAISTSVSVVWAGDRVETHAIFQDYYEMVAETPCARITAKAIEKEHERVMQEFRPKLLEKAETM